MELPNPLTLWLRYGELAKAVVQRLLSNRASKPTVRYFGVHFDMKDVKLAIEKDTYTHWDQNPTSPPMQRTRERLPDPTLSMLQWTGEAATFPETILQKFAEGTAHHAALLKIKADVEEMYPPPRVRRSSSGRVAVPRAGGRPDYSIEGGAQPIDVTREVDMAKISQTDFQEERHGDFCTSYQVLCFIMLHFSHTKNYCVTRL